MKGKVIISKTPIPEPGVITIVPDKKEVYVCFEDGVPKKFIAAVEGSVPPPEGQFYFDTNTNSLYVWNSLSSSWEALGQGTSVVVGAEPPSNPQTGDFWFDADNNTLKMWNGDSWVLVLNSVYSALTPPSNPKQGDLWFDLSTGVLNVWDGTSWQRISITLMQSSTEPPNPIIGDLWYDTSSGALYRWSGTQWEKISSQTIYSDTEPENPTVGDMWFETDTGKLFIYTGSGWQQVVSKITYSTSAPTNSSIGDLWFDTSQQVLKVWNGSSWILASATNFSQLSGYISPTQIQDNSLELRVFSKAAQPYSLEGFTFTANSNNSVTISNGTIRFHDGSTQSITGSTFSGLSVGVHYIYFTVGSSTLNRTTNFATAVGDNTNLLAVIYVPSDSSQLAAIFPATGKAPLINAEIIAANSISANHIKANSITADKLVTPGFYVEGLTLTANSPSSGYISWNSFKLYIGGSVYNISSGSTNLGFVYFNGSTTLQSTNDINTINPLNGHVLLFRNLSGTPKMLINATVVTGSMIQTGAVTTSHLAANSVTSDKIAAGSITSDKIAANSITSDKIAAGSINAGHISVTELSAISSSLGTITAGQLDLQAQSLSQSGTYTEEFNQHPPNPLWFIHPSLYHGSIGSDYGYFLNGGGWLGYNSGALEITLKFTQANSTVTFYFSKSVISSPNSFIDLLVWNDSTSVNSRIYANQTASSISVTVPTAGVYRVSLSMRIADSSDEPQAGYWFVSSFVATNCSIGDIRTKIIGSGISFYDSLSNVELLRITPSGIQGNTNFKTVPINGNLYVSGDAVIGGLTKVKVYTLTPNKTVNYIWESTARTGWRTFAADTNFTNAGFSYLSLGSLPRGTLVDFRLNFRGGTESGIDYTVAVGVYQGSSTRLFGITAAASPSNSSTVVSGTYILDADYSDVRIYPLGYTSSSTKLRIWSADTGLPGAIYTQLTVYLWKG